MDGKGTNSGMPARQRVLPIFNRSETDAMADNATNDFLDDKLPVEAYDEIRRWLSKWANQEFDLDKRLAALITLESLNSFVESMLRESSPN